MSLQAKLLGQFDDAPDRRITVFRRFRFMAAQHMRLVHDAEVVRGHQVVARARRDVQDFVRLHVKLPEHVFEALHARLVGAGFFGRDDGMKRCAELFDIAHDLRVVRVGQADQLVFLRKARETFRDVGMRPPRRHCQVELFGLASMKGTPVRSQVRRTELMTTSR